MINLKKEDNIFVGHSRIDGKPIFKYLRGNIPHGAVRINNNEDTNCLYFKLEESINRRLSGQGNNKYNFVKFYEL